MGAPRLLGSGEWGGVEDMEGRESIRRSLQGQVTPEFHLMEGRWGRGREEWGFGPNKGGGRSLGGEEEKPSPTALKDFPVLLPWRMGHGGRVLSRVTCLSSVLEKSLG